MKDIHIRYEDEFTNPQHPFVVGVSLRSLDFKVNYIGLKFVCCNSRIVAIFQLSSMIYHFATESTHVNYVFDTCVYVHTAAMCHAYG